MAYLDIGPLDKYPENSCKHVDLPDGTPILVVNLAGELSAFAAECSNGHILADAVMDAENERLLCPSHGWEIDLEECCCLAGPDCSIHKFPLRIEDNRVQIAEK
jgi:nitrite reductase/ring-hydroxylating ferredoxin subunit